jgi:hypothetical protein
MIGDMRGATNIAPMMTAGESVIKPKVAILQDNTTNKKKSKPGEADGATSSRTAFRLSDGNGLMIDLNQVGLFIEFPYFQYE